MLTENDMPNALSNWKLVFQALEKELAKIPDATENEFLSVSSLLHNCYERTWIIVDLFSSASVLLSGSDIANAIEELRSFMEKMNRYAKDSEANIRHRVESFNNILNKIEEIKQQLGEFKAISKNFRVIGTSASVYNNSIMQGNKDFSVFINDIFKLSDVITSRLATVKTDLNGVHKKIKHAIAKVISINEWQYRNMESVIDHIKSSLDALTHKYSTVTDKFGHTSEWSQEISKNIEKVVLSIQYHDITLQKFMRAKNSINDVTTKISNMPREANVNEFIEELVNFCDQQISYISNARDELSDAIANIVASMGDISRNAIALSEHTHMMTSSTNITGQSFFTEMGNSLGTVKSTLSKLNETNLEISKTLGAVNSAVNDITLVVNEIESIGGNASVIAFSAVRKASQSGKSGMIFGYFTKSIQKLWSESHNLCTKVLQSFQEAAALTGDLTAHIKLDIDKASADAYEMEQEMMSLITTLSNLSNNQSNHLANMDEEVQTLSKEIDTVFNRTDFLDNVIGNIGGVISMLGKMAHDLKKFMLSDIRGASSHMLEGDDQLTTQEVQESQFFGSLAMSMGNGGAKDSKSASEPADKNADGHLGNIEFFDSKYSSEDSDTQE